MHTAFSTQCAQQFAHDAAAGDRAIAGGDLNDLCRLAHSLKSVLLTLGHDSDSSCAARLEVEFATKPAIALAQIERLMEQGAPKHCLLADAGYGVDTAFREGLSDLGLSHVVGVTGSVTVWPPGRAPLPPAPAADVASCPRASAWGQPSTGVRSRSRSWRSSWNRRNGRPLSGVKAAASPYAHALPGFVCVRPIVTTSVRSNVPKSGCSWSGPKATRNR